MFNLSQNTIYPNLIIQPKLSVSKPIQQNLDSVDLKLVNNNNIDKTLKYEKLKIKQHAHMKNVFKSRRPTNSTGCSSCNAK